MNPNTPNPAQLQFPGLLAAVVNDAVQDGVPVPMIISSLELVKLELAISFFREESGSAPQASEPLIIPFTGKVPGT